MKSSPKDQADLLSVGHLLWVLAACALAGCAAADNAIRMNPTTTISAYNINTGIASAKSNLPQGMVLYSVDEDGTISQIKDLTSLSPELYATVDVSGVLTRGLAGQIKDKDTRNTIIEFLIYISDRNADIWMTRTYALNKLRKGVIGGTRDLATAGAGASAIFVPPAAVGLSAFNLLAGTASDEIDTTLYSKEAIETLFKGISAARWTQKNKIKTNLTLDYDKYDIFSALDQVRYYDSLVSFRKGLAYLANLADTKVQQAQNPTNSAVQAPLP